MKEVQVFLDEFCVSLRRKHMTLQTRFVFQLEGDARLYVQSLCFCEDMHDCLDKVCVSIRRMCVTAFSEKDVHDCLHFSEKDAHDCLDELCVSVRRRYMSV